MIEMDRHTSLSRTGDSRLLLALKRKWLDLLVSFIISRNLLNCTSHLNKIRFVMEEQKFLETEVTNLCLILFKMLIIIF